MNGTPLSFASIREPGWKLFKTAFERTCFRLQQRRAIGYIGWIGQANLGDEAMYAASRRLLAGRAVTAFRGARQEQILRRIGLSGRSVIDLVLLGGGTLINPGYLAIARRTLELGLPITTFGTGVGSPGFAAPPAVDLVGWQHVLNQFLSIGVRGPESKRSLEEIGVHRVEVIGDPALSLADDLRVPTSKRPKLAINLAIPPGGRYGEGECAPYRAVAQIAKAWLTQGNEIVLVSLGTGDHDALAALLSDIDRTDIAIHDCTNSVTHFLDLIRGSHLLIGVRLHAAVLACCAGVPPILFSYRDKCRDFMLSMDLGENLVGLDPSAPTRLRECMAQSLSQADSGARVLQRAKYWQQLQSDYIQDVVNRLSPYDPLYAM